MASVENRKFHPFADIFPLMEDAEFDELVADIKANGLREEIMLYEGMILDGRNRYRACLAAGWEEATILDSSHARHFDTEIDGDPAAYVISANIHRRHLTAEQKRELIAKLLKAAPEKSDRQIAKIVKVSPTTVGTKRAKMEKAGDVSKLDTRRDAKGRKQPARRKRHLGVTEGNGKPRPADDVQASAEAMKAKFAAADHADDQFLDDEGNYAPVDPAADAACRIRGFLYRAQQSTFAAEADDLKNIVCTKEIVEAAENAAKAWTTLARELRQNIEEIEEGESQTANDDRLDIPEFLRRDVPPKEVAA
jgi:ParB-like chromosome segregation protein Spo0J